MAREFPRSGVDGLDPLQVWQQVIRNEWPGPLPITANQKKPSILKWQQFAIFDSPPATPAELKKWASDAWHAPGTGIPCGNVIAINLDFVHDPKIAEIIERFAIEVFGATSLVRVGRAPKRLLVYRAAEPIASQKFKTADESGDGLDILAVGAQFVAFGIHPDTRQPYRWEGESPLTVSPQVAPAITAAQVEVFLDEVRSVVELRKSGGRKKPRTPGEAPETVQTTVDGVVGAYNKAMDLGALLVAHGYRRVGDRFIAPQSQSGTPGVAFIRGAHPPRIYSHHPGDPLGDGYSHDAFSVFRVLVHGGDLPAAIKDAARQLGLDADPDRVTLSRKLYRAAYELHREREDITAEAVAERGWAAYRATNPGNRWTEADAQS